MAASAFAAPPSAIGAGRDDASQDERFMRRCLELAQIARGRTSPNPLVGCVIVDARGRVVAEGYHARAGEPHAEITALARVRFRAPGATLYVNLEPCVHVGRTGPCAPEVIRSGVRRVVIGTRDPFPAVDGRGVRALRRAGIDVTVGVLEQACRAVNAPFFTYLATGRPYVTLKAALSLDGRIAARGGDARWISGPESRRVAHELRDEVDAVLVGVGTVLADDPRLTTRLPSRHRPSPWRPRDPLRVVLDDRLRTPAGAMLLERGAAAALIVTRQPVSAMRRRALERAGAEIVAVRSTRSGHVDPVAALHELATRGVRHVLVEGGSSVHGAFLSAGLWDRLVLFYAAKLLGDGGVPLAALRSPARVSQALRVRLVSCRSVGDDILVVAEPERS